MQSHVYEFNMVVKLRKFELYRKAILCRGGSRTATSFKIERFVIIVNGWKSLTMITKRSNLDVAEVLDPPLLWVSKIMEVIVKLLQTRVCSDYGVVSIYILLYSYYKKRGDFCNNIITEITCSFNLKI